MGTYLCLGNVAGPEAAWDAISVYDHTVIGDYTKDGRWMFLAYKYSGSMYGMLMSVPFNYRKIVVMSVIEGTKLVHELS